MRQAIWTALAALWTTVWAAPQGERLRDPGFENPSAGWSAFEQGFEATATGGRQGGAIRCVNTAPDQRRGAMVRIELNQTTPTPVLVSGWSRAEDVSGTPSPDYAVYVDVDYADGTHLWGIVAPFATGTHDWQRRKVLVSPAKPIRALNVYALFRRHTGTVWFDDFSVVELAGDRVFDSQRLVPPTLPPGATSGWFVRDVAADGGLVPAARAGALGLRVTVKASGDRLDAALTDMSGRDRAATLYYVERFAATRWWNDVRQAQPATGERANLASVQLGAAGAVSVYPYACVADAKRARALAFPPDAGPRIARLGYHGGARLLWAAFDLGLSPAHGKPSASASVLRWDADPAWGLRGVVVQYQRRFPDGALRRAKADGLWIPFTDPAIVKGLSDFGIAYHEGDNSVVSDDRLGILSFRYTEPMSWWMVMPPQMPRTYENALALAKKKAAGDDPEEKKWAQALLSSGAQGLDGRFLGDFQKAPWADGIAWLLSPDPNLTGPTRKADLVYTPAAADKRYKTDGTGLDGEYLDSLEMWLDVPNYRPEQLRASSLPLTFAADTLRPVVPMGFSVWEQARAMSADLHRRGKLLMANTTPVRAWAFAPLMDVMGIEVNWTPGGVWTPESDATLLQRRTLSGTKPYLLLQNTDLEKFGPYVERYFQRCLCYGIFPSFFSIDAANDNYWDRPKWHNRDRPLFVKYLPALKAISAAGWEPIPFARTDNPKVYVERFGNTYLTLLNDTAAPQSATLTIDVARIVGQAPPGKTLTLTDAVTGEVVAKVPAAATVRIPLRLAPEQGRALRLVNGASSSLVPRLGSARRPPRWAARGTGNQRL